MKPLSNKIFVTIEKKFQDEIETKSGITLFKDTTFSPEENVTNFGTVVGIPEVVDRKTIGPDFKHNVQLGDKLYFHYNTILDSDNLIIHEGEEYWTVDYWAAIARVRDGVIEPVGSYILIEPQEQEVLKSSLIIIPDHVAKKDITRGKVFASNDPDIPVGVDVEYQAHAKFWNIIEGKKLYCPLNKNILFIYEQENC